MTADIENGYTRIANEIADAMCQLKCSNYESRFLWALFRKTYGFHKKEDFISLTQFSVLTGIPSQHIARTKTKLIEKGIIYSKGKKIGFNKELHNWVVPIQVVPNEVVPKQVTASTYSGSQPVPKQVLTKETLTKETIQKKEGELEQYLKTFNEVYGTKYKSVVALKKNFELWRKEYSIEEVLRAVKRSKNVFWAKQPTPELILRTRNKNGECDYIGEILNSKSKEEIAWEKELEGMEIRE